MDHSGAKSPTEAISEALRGFGYRFDVSPDCSDYRFQICTRPGEFWRAQMLVAHDVVQLYVYLTDVRYLEEHQPLVIEMVCGLNSSVAVLGSFEFEWESGSVQYHSPIDLRGHQNIVGAVERHLNAVRFPVALWHRCFSRVGKTKASTGAIISAALVGEECPPKDVTRETRRMLLKLVKDEKSNGQPSSCRQADIARNLDILLTDLNKRSS